MAGAHYLQLIADLQSGRIIQRKEKGNSMVPLIRSGQPHTLEPVRDLAALQVGDIVFCKVRGHYYTHLISAIRKNKDQLEFQISNNHGHVNGWTRNVYGKVIGVGEEAPKPPGETEDAKPNPRSPINRPAKPAR